MRALPSLHSVSLRSISSAVTLSLLCLLISCGGNATTTTTTTTGSITNQYAAAYKAMTWATGVTVTFPSSCSMTVSASGVPPFHNDYYLAPATTGQTVVATTPSGIQLAVVPYSSGISTVNTISATFNICPAKAASTTATQGGAIGLISSGEVLFDPYEATNTVALGDDASYTFTPSGSTTQETAYFIDQCNSHPTGGMGGSSGSTWHYHGVPSCWTPTVDGATGPSHIIGIALDGFPIYGGRDINGNIIPASSLDACNGITSATPEFPSGAYHYVLPIGVTTMQSSIGCYVGTVGTSIAMWAKQLKCNTLMAMQTAPGKPHHWVPALPPVANSKTAKWLAAQDAATRQAARARGRAGRIVAAVGDVSLPRPGGE